MKWAICRFRRTPGVGCETALQSASEALLAKAVGQNSQSPFQ